MAKKQEKKKVVEQGTDEVLELIRKQFGNESVMKLNPNELPEKIPAIPTGSIALDIALGIGGVPQGRIIEIYGPESSGKTTLTLHLAKEAQKLGKKVAFVDAEHALDIKYAKNIGVNVHDLYVSQPDSGEKGLQLVEAYIETKKVGLVIVDSVSALTPQAEIDGEIGDSHVGLQARMMSQALRKITGMAFKNGCTIIFINQLREKIGIKFGNPETTSGGNALKFYASVRLDIRQTKVAGGDDSTERNMKVTVKKNKVAPPFGQVEVPITFGIGIDLSSELYNLAIKEEFGLIEKRGGGHYYRGSKTVEFVLRDEHGNPQVDSDGKEIKMKLVNDLKTLVKEDGSSTKELVNLEAGELNKLGSSMSATRIFLRNHPEIYAVLKEEVMEMLEE